MTLLYTLNDRSKLVIKYNTVPKMCSVCRLTIPKFKRHLVQGYYWDVGWYRTNDREHFCGKCCKLDDVLRFLKLRIEEKHFRGIGIAELRKETVTGFLKIDEGRL